MSASKKAANMNPVVSDLLRYLFISECRDIAEQQELSDEAITFLNDILETCPDLPDDAVEQTRQFADQQYLQYMELFNNGGHLPTDLPANLYFVSIIYAQLNGDLSVAREKECRQCSTQARKQINDQKAATASSSGQHPQQNVTPQSQIPPSPQVPPVHTPEPPQIRPPPYVAPVFIQSVVDIPDNQGPQSYQLPNDSYRIPSTPPSDDVEVIEIPQTIPQNFMESIQANIPTQPGQSDPDDLMSSHHPTSNDDVQLPAFPIQGNTTPLPQSNILNIAPPPLPQMPNIVGPPQHIVQPGSMPAPATPPAEFIASVADNVPRRPPEYFTPSSPGSISTPPLLPGLSPTVSRNDSPYHDPSGQPPTPGIATNQTGETPNFPAMPSIPSYHAPVPTDQPTPSPFSGMPPTNEPTYQPPSYDDQPGISPYMTPMVPQPSPPPLQPPAISPPNQPTIPPQFQPPQFQPPQQPQYQPSPSPVVQQVPQAPVALDVETRLKNLGAALLDPPRPVSEESRATIKRYIQYAMSRLLAGTKDQAQVFLTNAAKSWVTGKPV